MKTQFKLGQIVIFKDYKRNKNEKEAYFLVVQEEQATKTMVLYAINTNRIYGFGTTVVPDFPHEDLQIVDLRPSDLINHEITIQDNTINDLVLDVAVYFHGDNDPIQFKQVGDCLVANVLFEFPPTLQHQWQGNIQIDLTGPL
jgi:hypothetical protein